jgi:hypothetical protein
MRSAQILLDYKQECIPAKCKFDMLKQSFEYELPIYNLHIIIEEDMAGDYLQFYCQKTFFEL